MLPIKADGTKYPDLPTWAEWQHKRPSPQEVAGWFAHCDGYGFVCGRISGGLEVVDFDDGALFEPWCALVEIAAPGLLAGLPVDQTPGDGYHAYYRCVEIAGNMKLARAQDGNHKALIETRGEGGYIVVPPTAARYHEKKKPYRMLRGDLTAIPEITRQERAILLEAATTFNQYTPRIAEPPKEPGANAGNRPGDKWAADQTWAQILEPHGWRALGQRGEVIYWQRPGKDGPGCSATTGHNGHDVLYVFSSNALPFDSEAGYSKFTAHAFLNHGGDFTAATKEVVALGYGDPPSSPPLPEEPPWAAQDDVEAMTPGDTNTGRNPPTAPQKAQISSWLDLGKLLGPITWAWAQWLAIGFLTLLAGSAGKGKSTLALRIAACFLRGDPWPDGSTFTGERGWVLWCETEGAQALNLERAGKWGLNIDHIKNPLADPLGEVNLDNPQHKQAIEAAARLPEVRLIIIDSLSGALGPGRDEKDPKMLTVVKWLAHLARDTGKPVLVTHHLRKRGLLETNDEVTLDRVRGSSAIVQASRMVWGMDCPDPAQKDTLRMLVIKSNLGRFPPPIGLTIDDFGMNFTGAPERPRKPTKLETAKQFLQQLLRNGPVTADTAEQQVANEDISVGTASRAKTALRIDSRRVGETWYWYKLGEQDELMKAIEQMDKLSRQNVES